VTSVPGDRKTSAGIEYLNIDPPWISLSFVNLRLFVIPPLPGVLECAYTQTMNEDSITC